jgi:hypothetical protein
LKRENAARLRAFIVVVMEMNERDRYEKRAKVARDILDYMDDMLDQECDQEEVRSVIGLQSIDAQQLAMLMAED